MSLISSHVPDIPVSHLPSASSFYASLTQSLNIRYLSATTTYPATLHFGRLTPDGKETLFSLTQSPVPQPRPTTIYLPATSPKQVQDFYNKSLLLNPGCYETGCVELNSATEGEGTKAFTRDLDGHYIQAIYTARAITGGDMETASTVKEARRVLEWQKDVAKSTVSGNDDRSQASGGSRAVTRRAESYPVPAVPQPPPMRLVRRETVTETWSPSYDEGQQQSSGISSKAIIGTLLGAAAGAAVAYAMVRSEEPSPRPAPSQRRASFHSPPAYEVLPARSHVSARDIGRQEDGMIRYAIAPAPDPPLLVRADTWGGGSNSGVREIKALEERSHVSIRSSGSQRSSKVRSRSEHPSASQVGSRFDRPLSILPAPERDEAGSHVSSRSKKSRAKSQASHSRSKDVIEVFEDDNGSVAQSSHSRRSKHSHHSKSSHHHHHHGDKYQASAETDHGDEVEGSHYTTARSTASSSTIKPPKSSSGKRRSSRPPISSRSVTEGNIIIVGKEGSRSIHSHSHKSHSKTRAPIQQDDRRSYVSARDVPLPRSTVSVARGVPLPVSVVGSRRGKEVVYSDEEGSGSESGGYMRRMGGAYAASVAPSDSVSCVGSKRERERLRGRMSAREGGW